MTADASHSPPPSPARRRLLKGALTGLAAGGLALGLDQHAEADALTVTRCDISLPGWPRSATGMRLGQLSDLHCDTLQAVKRARRAVQLMLAQKPHAVFLTGDYITYKPARWAAQAAAALAPLVDAVPGGVFAILGNHDWWSGGCNIMARHLAQVGMTVLRNASAPLPGVPGVWIVGLDDYCVQAQDPERAMHAVPPDALKILLVHEPDYADICPPGFALQFSGHSHAGQIRVPGLPPLLCPKYGRHYPEGLQAGPRHPVYTTRGVGMIGPQIRLFCPPEVTVMRVLSPPASPA